MTGHQRQGALSFATADRASQDARDHNSSGPAERRLLLDGFEVGWCEAFHDPLLDADVLRMWLNAAPLRSDQLTVLSHKLVGEVEALTRSLATSRSRPICAVESNRIFPIYGTKPASVLLRFGSAPLPCGTCRWRLFGCDEWFVEQLVASFAGGCRRMGANVEPERIRDYVVNDLALQQDWQWWGLSTDDGARSGVVMSYGHEDPADGRPYAQCVDAVGQYSPHFSCLAAQLEVELNCEVRGEVTTGTDWSRERRVIGRLHAQGWRLRGLTSLVSTNG